MLSEIIWRRLGDYARGKLLLLYDPDYLFAEDRNLREDTELKHKGLYIGVVSSSGNELACEGFLHYASENIFASCELVVNNLFQRLKEKNIDKSSLETGTVYLTVIQDCIYLKNPLEWDENKDGIHFQWGQKYKAIYLPYQITRMSCPKIEIMDRLCASCGIISNAWRLPEGLVHRLIAATFAC